MENIQWQHLFKTVSIPSRNIWNKQTCIPFIFFMSWEDKITKILKTVLCDYLMFTTAEKKHKEFRMHATIFSFLDFLFINCTAGYFALKSAL